MLLCDALNIFELIKKMTRVWTIVKSVFQSKPTASLEVLRAEQRMFMQGLYKAEWKIGEIQKDTGKKKNSRG